MAKCTGVRCPMQYGYKVEECNHTDCPYRTEPVTNADKIRAMSDDELAWVLLEYRFDACCKAHGGEAGLPDSQSKIVEWLKQPAEIKKL